MKQKKIPMRRCVVSQQMFPKKELVRIVRQPDGTVVIDKTGRTNGRGAYIACEPELVPLARKNQVFSKQLDVAVPDAFYDELAEYLAYKKARSLL